MQATTDDIPARSRFDLPSALLGILVGGIAVAMWLRGAPTEIAIGATAAVLVYAVAIRLTQPEGRGRMLVHYVTVCGLYGGSTSLIDALRMPTHEATLLRLDRLWFGETPSVALSGFFSPTMNDLWSGLYLGYHVYLHVALIDALLRSGRWRGRYGQVVFSTFAIGLAGYFLYPARGPEVAFPELFASPLHGGALTRLNTEVVARLASRYDAFPSLHVLVTAALLACDWRWCQTRFRIMLLPGIGLMFATLPLRLHFAVDLLAGALLLGPVLWLTLPKESDDDA